MSWLRWHCSALRLWGKKHPLVWALIKVVVIAGIAAAVVRIV